MFGQVDASEQEEVGKKKLTKKHGVASKAGGKKKSKKRKVQTRKKNCLSNTALKNLKMGR